MDNRRFYRIALGLPVLYLAGWGMPPTSYCHAQPQTATASEPPTSTDELALSQSRLADKYANLEKLLLRMAEYDAGLNPQRAELLKRVFAESKDRQVQRQFEKLVQLLQEEQLGRALGNQKELRGDLDALLKLLMSEDRSDRIKSEKARLREYIRELERLQRMQRSVQGRTEGGIREGDAASEQKDLAERTQALHQEIEKNEQPTDTEAANESTKSTGRDPSSPSDPSDKSDSSDSSDKSDPSDKSDSSDSPADPQQGESAPADSGSRGESPPPQAKENEFPGQQNLRKARQAMERAVEKLNQAERDGAVREQQEAAKELAEAKARLEAILRQLREEEIERTLAMLETRVKAMLDMEIRIHDDTMRLDQLASKRSDRSWEIEAGKLSMDQRRVVQEADKALALLRDEGSSSAFPETLSQARADMEQVAARLAQAKAGGVTQTIEEDIIAALEEMLEALKQAQNDQRQRQQNQAPGQQSDPGDMPLVDQIAELKMIKSLQLRINRRTDRYAQLLDNDEDEIGQATDAELLTALQDLSTREARLHELTRDIVLGKNR